MIYKKNKIIFEKEIRYYFNKKKGNFIDCTFGNGLHSKLILKIISKGLLLAFEIEKEYFAKNKIKKKNFFIINKCFTKLKNFKIKKISILLIDIGFTENQIINFNSFKNEKILLYLNKYNNKINIIEKINFGSYNEIFDIFKNFTKKFFCKIFSKSIIKYRKKKLIIFISQIKEIILKIFKKKFKKSKKNIFTKFISAIINYCFETKKKIKKLLSYIVNIIKKKGKIIIITFNSFESKIIKKFFKYKKNFLIKKKIKKKNKIIRIYEKKK
ncbi:16S rRNA (cytosine(1402)-N(4))-methyltransferase [Candidatus Vidania fulgoroideorum]